METNEQIEELMKQMGDKVTKENKAQVEEFFRKTLIEKKSPAEALGLTKEMKDYVYAMGYKFYNNGQYKKALPAFSALQLWEMAEPKYSFALAATHHRLQDYSTAAFFYVICMGLDMLNPEPSFQAADCYLKLDQPAFAILMLKQAIESAQDSKYASIKNQSELLLSALEAKSV